MIWFEIPCLVCLLEYQYQLKEAGWLVLFDEDKRTTRSLELLLQIAQSIETVD